MPFRCLKANTIKFYNFAPSTAQKLNKRIMQFWFAGIVFSLMHGMLKVRRLSSCTQNSETERLYGIGRPSL